MNLGRAWRDFLTWYFGPWELERRANGRIYELLGIRLWKRWLRTSGDPASRWRSVTRVDGRKAKLVARLRQQDRFTHEYEVRHLLGGVTMQVAGAVLIPILNQGSMVFVTFANLFINGYPILLQRYNRVRVQAALDRISRLEGSAAQQRFAADDGR